MKRHALIKTATIFLMAAAIPHTAMANMTKGVQDDSVKVSYADIDTQDPAGQKVLYQRLKLAAIQICGPTEVTMTGSLSRARANQLCYSETLENAVGKLNMPAIQKLHNR